MPGKNPRALKALINKGARLNQKGGDEKWTAMFYAAELGHNENLRILIRAGANLNITDLMMVVGEPIGSEKLPMIKLLVKNGADVNAQDNRVIITARRPFTFQERSFIIALNGLRVLYHFE